MKKTICYIDDKIPVGQYSDCFDDTRIINSSVLRFLLKTENTQWDDSNVKNVISNLLKAQDDWNVYAFTAPQFFINHCQEEIFSPEIILYDWDFNDGLNSNSSETYLLNILEKNFSYICVYTGADNNNEVSDIINSETFSKYKDRVELISKSDNDSFANVIDNVRKKFDTSFSYKYGRKLTHLSNKTINEILAKISSLSIDDFVNLFGEKQDGKYILSSEEFTNIVFSKYRQDLINLLSAEPPINADEVQKNIDDSIKEIWSYRLYTNTNSDNVRQGDIIRKEDELFLVFSSNCHLSQFWHKNHGYISLIPLINIGNTSIKTMFGSSNAKNFSISSLTSPTCGITILPFVKHEDHFTNYVLIPKGIVSENIKFNGISKRIPFKYSEWADVTKVTSISDEFCSALIQFIHDNISGYGCADFSDKISTFLNTEYKNSIE